MEFGKPQNPSEVDWTLAPDTELTRHVLAAQEGSRHTVGLSPKPESIPHIFIGSTSWGDKEYLGEVYPAKTKAADFLNAYGKQFNTIELNTTFYRMPTAHQAANWAAKVPADFRFCPKVNKLLSQSKELGVGTNRITEFCEGVRGFGEKLGPCFIQLPKHFDTSKLETLLSFFDKWPSDIRLAVELRHPSWFTESSGADLFAELFTRGLGTTISDVGARRDVAHMNLTADFFLLRWVGNLHLTDKARLDEWSKRIATWMSSGLREVFAFTHQPVAPEAAKSAIIFEKLLKKHYPASLEIRSPTLIETPGQQTELFG